MKTVETPQPKKGNAQIVCHKHNTKQTNPKFVKHLEVSITTFYNCVKYDLLPLAPSVECTFFMMNNKF